ncbi:MAG: hypothetical protein FD146_110 [Anaerolineaceae bacterium]|nr:MAG: hypothetical protein FD146_110 [Anaerolineaceae bacterium]
MKAKLTQFAVALQKIDRRYVQLAVVVAALALMVLGVGAPDDSAVPVGR